MKYLFLFVTTLIVLSCENNSFDKDKRQLIAKSEIREKLGNIRSFDVTSFKEDTLGDWKDSELKNLIRYNLDVVYKDSTGATQNRQAFVIFTPDGKSVISSHINN